MCPAVRDRAGRGNRPGARQCNVRVEPPFFVERALMTTTIPDLDTAVCGLLPHAPILVPAVAGPDIAQCRRTSEACAELARRVAASRPDRLFLVSPHAPRADEAFGLYDGVRLSGSLSRFGAYESVIDLPNDTEARGAILEAAAAAGIATWDVPRTPLDHGAVVPLWFLTAAGWRGPTCIAALPWSTTTDRCADFGRAVAAAYARVRGRVALIASGDMTHRAVPGAPAGHDPRGVEFDRTMTGLVAEGRLRDVSEIDPTLRVAAAEDSVESSTIVSGALGFRAHGAEVLGYEHPFGVGYLVAVFHDGGE